MMCCGVLCDLCMVVLVDLCEWCWIDLCVCVEIVFEKVLFDEKIFECD